jgi:hypothetical protein
MNDSGIDATNMVPYDDDSSYVIVHSDPESSDRDCHIDGQYKKIQELATNNVLSFKWILALSHNLDSPTKQLCGFQFAKPQCEVGMLDIKD